MTETSGEVSLENGFVTNVTKMGLLPMNGWKFNTDVMTRTQLSSLVNGTNGNNVKLTIILLLTLYHNGQLAGQNVVKKFTSFEDCVAFEKSYDVAPPPGDEVSLNCTFGDMEPGWNTGGKSAATAKR